MATHYPSQQVGVSDGTVPVGKADGREVGATKRSILATKVPGTTWASGDTVVLGTLPVGTKLTEVLVTTNTSFGTSTLSIGKTGSTAKYVNAATNTVVDKPVIIGPLATALDDAPLTAEEDVILTIGTADIASATIATFELKYSAI